MSPGGAGRGLAAAATAAGLAWGGLRLAGSLPPAWRRPWARRNHAGCEVTLLEGPAVVGGLLVGGWVAGAPVRDSVLVLVPGVLGGADDLVGDTGTKGLRGHLGALAEGRVTTGAAKLVGLSGAALLAAALEPPLPGDLPRSAAVLRDAVVVAGSANLVNLLDLRPGRALKVALATGAVAALAAGEPGSARPGARPAAVTVVGAACGALPDDLAGRSMLGDCGANPLGALVGISLVRALGPRGRIAVAGTLVGLTLLSERVSFTRVIESTPWLHRLDMWGRRPPQPAPQGLR